MINKLLIACESKKEKWINDGKWGIVIWLKFVGQNAMNYCLRFGHLRSSLIVAL